jgi:hypothetical protein
MRPLFPVFFNPIIWITRGELAMLLSYRFFGTGPVG